MKLASPFSPACPGCGRKLPGDPFSGKGEKPWKCLGCRRPVCCWCYVGHTAFCCKDLGYRAFPMTWAQRIEADGEADDVVVLTKPGQDPG